MTKALKEVQEKLNANLTSGICGSSNARTRSNEVMEFIPLKPQLPAVVLDEKGDFESWRQHIRNELRSFKLDYLAFEDSKIARTLLGECTAAAKAWLYTYLSARVSNEYRKTVCYEHITDPKDFMKKLEQIRNPGLSFVNYDAKCQWNTIIYAQGKEMAEEFITRYNQAKLAVEKIMTVTPEDAIENFLMACRNTVHELTYHKLANPMLSLSDLQGFLWKVESDTKKAENCE